MNPSLTFCGVFRNEQDRIRYVLDIGKALCKDMVIVVQESSDNTLKICKEYTQTVIERPSESPEESKDYIMENVKTPWTFWLDADEMPSVELIDYLSYFSPPGEYDGIKFPRINYINGLRIEANQGEDEQYRLMANSVRWKPLVQGRRIHIHPIIQQTLSLGFPLYHHRTLEKIERQTKRWNELEKSTVGVCNDYVKKVKEELKKQQ